MTNVNSIHEKHFPVLSIQEYKDTPLSEGSLLFHNLHGKREIDKPHKHDFFMFLLFEKGAGSHTIDFVKYGIKDRQVHLIFPNQVHQWQIEHGTLGYQLMVEKNLFERLMPSLRFSQALYQKHPVLQLSVDEYQKIYYEFQEIRELLVVDEKFWELLSCRLQTISLLVSNVTCFSDEVKNYATNSFLSKFITLIEMHFKKERSVAFYADELHISSNYLNIICKRHLYVPASYLIQHRSLLEAKRLLKASDISIKEIVYELNFYDHASFSKFFKMHTGMTPSAFRNQTESSSVKK